MVEVEEWAHVNRELRHHGFPAVEFVNPNQAKNISDFVLLTQDADTKLRKTLITLIKDCDRRQELVQELIITNTQLRDDLKVQASVTEKYELKSKDLQSLLEDSRFKIQELEDEKWNMSITSTDEGKRLHNTKDAAVAKCNQLTHKCQLYQQEIERLQAKLRQITLEEESRKKKQSEVLKLMRCKWAKGSAANDHMLTVIDWYESQLAELRQELNLAVLDGNLASSETSIHDNNTSRISTNSTITSVASGHYKALVKSYERQLRDSKRMLKTLENEVELLKLELQSRPHINDLRDAQAHIKKLERILKIHGICPSHSSDKKSKMLFSTKVEDIEFLPVTQCRHYLKSVCMELDIDNVEKAQSKVRQLIMDSESLPHLRQFSESVIEIVKPKSPGQQGAEHAIWCEKTKQQVISTLQHWSIQIQAIQELQQSIHRLVAAFLPWKQLDNINHPTIKDLIQQVDELIEHDLDEHSNEDHCQGKPKQRSSKENPSRAVLFEIVSHFQLLFDVPSIRGVYVCMNDLYTRIGEMKNIMKTLKDLLGLESHCKVSAIVEAVIELCNNRQQATTEYLARVLGTDDLDSVVQKLQEHDEFFSVFSELLQKIMETLNVENVDQVLPAIQALKLLASS